MTRRPSIDRCYAIVEFVFEQQAVLEYKVRGSQSQGSSVSSGRGCTKRTSLLRGWRFATVSRTRLCRLRRSSSQTALTSKTLQSRRIGVSWRPSSPTNLCQCGVKCCASILAVTLTLPIELLEDMIDKDTSWPNLVLEKQLESGMRTMCMIDFEGDWGSIAQSYQSGSGHARDAHPQDWS